MRPRFDRYAASELLFYDSLIPRLLVSLCVGWVVTHPTKTFLVPLSSHGEGLGVRFFFLPCHRERKLAFLLRELGSNQDTSDAVATHF